MSSLTFRNSHQGLATCRGSCIAYFQRCLVPDATPPPYLFVVVTKPLIGYRSGVLFCIVSESTLWSSRPYTRIIGCVVDDFHGVKRGAKSGFCHSGRVQISYRPIEGFVIVQMKDVWRPYETLQVFCLWKNRRYTDSTFVAAARYTKPLFKCQYGRESVLMAGESLRRTRRRRQLFEYGTVRPVIAVAMGGKAL